jgi:asparagine synthase (glutamine-hydrolysing)
MNYRGPDWTFSKLIKKNIFFGQNVLSMTGKNIKNDKIFQSKNKNFNLLLNGEIYNYKELSKLVNIKHNQNLTDTEVLVNLAEKKTTKQINQHIDGMYVYALHDDRRNELTISRDLQGEKSLYVYEDNLFIIISSEIASIDKYVESLLLDVDVLKSYFYTKHFMQYSSALFKKITILKPGETKKLNLINFKWKISNTNSILDLINEDVYSSNLNKSLDDLTDELEFILNRNLKQMIPNSRNFSSIISGGIDSSLITSLLNKISQPTKLISLDHIGKDSITKHLNAFSKHLKRDINIYKVYAKDYLENLVEISNNYYSPIHSHSFVGQYMIAKKSNELNCRALFGGEGADELFGGYTTYQQNTPNKNLNYSDYSKLTDQKLFKNNESYFEFKDVMNEKWLEYLNRYSFITNKDEKSRQSMLLADTNIQLSTVGLRGADLMSMRNSVEQRSIFLRKDIIKFALNLPLKFKLNKNDKSENGTKIILKNLFKRHFPEKLNFKKEGFAGFPNSTKKILGNTKNYQIKKYLDFKNFNDAYSKMDNNLSWKIYNTELFLKNLNKRKQ